MADTEAPDNLRPTDAEAVAPAPEARINVRHHDGTTISIPASSLDEAAAKGWRPISEEEERAGWEQQTYGEGLGNEAAAFAEGALRGGTLGLYDAVAPALGVDEEGIRLRQEQSPNASLGGEVLGAVGGALIGGAPANLATRAGASTGAKVAAKTGSKVIGAVAGGATEGFIYGAGQGVSNVSLAEDPMSAEAALAEIGTSALLGGVTGGVVGGGAGLLGEAMEVGKRAAGRAASRLDDVAAGAATKADDVAKVADDVVPAPAPGAKAREAMDGVAAPKPAPAAPAKVDYAPFRKDYEQLDHWSAQMLRRAERKQYANNEAVQAAAADLRAARKASNEMVPARRAYEVEAGGAQGKKAPYDWEKVDDAALDGIHGRPDFETTLTRHEDALAGMKSAFGDKFEPFKVGRIARPAAAAPEAEVVAAVQGSGLPGLKKLAELPPEAVPAVKAAVEQKAAEGFGLKDLAAGVAGDWLLTAVTGAAGGLGGMVGGVIGRRLLGKLARGSASALKGGVTERVAELGIKAAKTAEAVLGAGQKVAKRTPALAVLASARFFDSDDSKPKNAQEAYQARSKEIQRAQANPMALRQRIHDGLAGFWQADPLLADKMESLAMARVDFLASKMPRDLGGGMKLTKSRYQPSDQDVNRWARYVEAAENPSSVLDSLAAGTVTKEEIETLQTLYPSMYSAVKIQILTQAPQLEAALPYSTEVMLSAFMGVPVNGLMQPQSVAMLQSTFAPSEEEQQPPPSKPASPPTPTYAQKRSGA